MLLRATLTIENDGANNVLPSASTTSKLLPSCGATSSSSRNKCCSAYFANTLLRPGSTPTPSSANSPFAAHLSWAANCMSPGTCHMYAIHVAHPWTCHMHLTQLYVGQAVGMDGVGLAEAECHVHVVAAGVKGGLEHLGHVPARTSSVTECTRALRCRCEGWGDCL